uniref:Cytochrome c oxidase subunit n=1 Tax=Rhabditophanes sp. KR3021 TaxID=114890 RepID=A0AC35UB03_9BILA
MSQNLRLVVSSRQIAAFIRNSHHAADAGKPNLELFKRINRFGSQGLWDNVNNAPKLGMCSPQKDAVYQAYNEMLETKSSYFETTPWGKYLKFFYRSSLFVLFVFAVLKTYETVLPESYRLAIKYAPKHDHKEEHH